MKVERLFPKDRKLKNIKNEAIEKLWQQQGSKAMEANITASNNRDPWIWNYKNSVNPTDNNDTLYKNKGLGIRKYPTSTITTDKTRRNSRLSLHLFLGLPLPLLRLAVGKVKGYKS